VLRGERAATIGMLVIVMGLNALGATTDPLVEIPVALIDFSILVLLATRGGLVALVTALWISRVANAMVLFTFPDCLTSMAVLGFAAMLAPGVFGFYTSLAGRNTAAAKWLDN
jgi:hypothetical protein